MRKNLTLKEGCWERVSELAALHNMKPLDYLYYLIECEYQINFRKNPQQKQLESPQRLEVKDEPSDSLMSFDDF
jgi:hypothetical protein